LGAAIAASAIVVVRFDAHALQTSGLTISLVHTVDLKRGAIAAITLGCIPRSAGPTDIYKGNFVHGFGCVAPLSVAYASPPTVTPLRVFPTSCIPDRLKDVSHLRRDATAFNLISHFFVVALVNERLLSHLVVVVVVVIIIA
jgi:hypothetical protein